MTVIVDQAIRQRIWRGYDDPGLPVGMYIGQAQLAGDASGGDQRIIFVFKEEGDSISGRFFNLEQVESHRSGNTATVDWAMSPANFDRAGNVEIAERNWVATLTANSRSGIQALEYRNLPPLPVFLGQLSLDLGTQSDILIATDNTNGTILFATIQGYIWEARSVQAPGGLRRPDNSLYR